VYERLRENTARHTSWEENPQLYNFGKSDVKKLLITYALEKGLWKAEDVLKALQQLNPAMSTYFKFRDSLGLPKGNGRKYV